MIDWLVFNTNFSSISSISWGVQILSLAYTQCFNKNVDIDLSTYHDFVD
jgi:hypothetical protein